MSESRVRENRTHGSMRRREATTASRASTRRAAAEAPRRPYTRPQPAARPLAIHLTYAQVQRQSSGGNRASAGGVCVRNTTDSRYVGFVRHPRLNAAALVPSQA